MSYQILYLSSSSAGYSTHSFHVLCALKLELIFDLNTLMHWVRRTLTNAQ